VPPFGRKFKRLGLVAGTRVSFRAAADRTSPLVGRRDPLVRGLRLSKMPDARVGSLVGQLRVVRLLVLPGHGNGRYQIPVSSRFLARGK
jgi:hypothetical protein